MSSCGVFSWLDQRVATLVAKKFCLVLLCRSSMRDARNHNLSANRDSQPGGGGSDTIIARDRVDAFRRRARDDVYCISLSLQVLV